MMQKTIKKTKREGAEKTKSFIATESGLVENEDNPDDRVGPKRKEHKSLLDSVTEIEVARRRLKDDAMPSSEPSSKRRTSMLPEEQAASNDDPNRRSSLRIAEVAAAKSKFSSMLSKRNSSIKSEDMNLVKASKASTKQLGAMFMVTKAIAFMNNPRKKRKSGVNKVFIEFWVLM